MDLKCSRLTTSCRRKHRLGDMSQKSLLIKSPIFFVTRVPILLYLVLKYELDFFYRVKKAGGYGWCQIFDLET